MRLIGITGIIALSFILFPALARADDRLIATGSGVIINDRTVLTNYHVVKGCSNIEAHNAFIKPVYSDGADITVHSDKYDDLSVVTFPAHSFRESAFISAGEMPGKGTPIYMLSYPETEGRVEYAAGEITSDWQNSGLFIHNAPLASKTAGGSVFDKASNELIGIYTASYNPYRHDGRLYVIGLKVEIVRMFLDKLHIPYNQSRAAPADISRAAVPNLMAAVGVECLSEGKTIAMLGR